MLPLSLYRERSVGPASHTGDGPYGDPVCVMANLRSFWNVNSQMFY